jgi:hypothetical protein
MTATRIIRRADVEPADLARVRFAEQQELAAMAAPVIGPIEKNVPMPNQGGRRTNPVTLALLEMQVGDSRFVRGIKRPQAHGYASAARERLGKSAKFATRAMPDGVRIWREA